MGRFAYNQLKRLAGLSKFIVANTLENQWLQDRIF
jgi:hypothetical protein